MSSDGKYVRVAWSAGETSETDIHNADTANEVGKFVRAPNFYDNDYEQDNVEGDNDGEYDDYNVIIDPNQKNEELRKQVAKLQKTIDELSAITKARQDQNPEKSNVDDSWSSFREIPSTSHGSGQGANIRWDQIKPFPKGVPANKMWEEWRKYIENFEIAASLSNAFDPVRRSQLLFLSMGGELQSIVRAAKLRPSLNDKHCYLNFIKNIESHLRSMTDVAAEHQAFLCMQQEKGESVVNFHARLMEQVQLCNYSPGNEDCFVKAQLLKGMTNRELARTANTFSLDTNLIVQSATRDEAYQIEKARANNLLDTSINAVREHAPKPPLKRHQELHSGNGSDSWSGNKRPRFSKKPPSGRRERCARCNRWAHWDRSCPALKLRCNGCGMTGHFAAACRQKRINAVDGKQETTVELKMEELNTLSLEDVLIDCRLGSTSTIKFMIDSGADVNVIGGNDWQNLKKSFESGLIQLQPIKICADKGLQAYASATPMKIDFAFRTTIEINGESNSVVADFVVVSKGKRSLLGRSTASDLKVLFVGPQVNDCEALDVGVFPKMPGVLIKFSVDKTIAPTRNAYYNIPAAYREGARSRLSEMERSGIIERVTSAPEWISGMSAVPKGKGDFRLVVNMRAPNRAIKREYFRLPLIDEMKVKLHGAKYFTKLDLKSAYYHLELDPESRDLTTFLAESGMFRFTRLMFGVNAAPEIFQREMSRILEDVENKIVYIDDVLLFADSLEELHKTVDEVHRILKENNLTLNCSKCEYDKTSITFLGHELDEDGFHIDESKIVAIQKFRRPNTASELRSFLGLASFVSPYIRNFATISNPLWAAIATKTWIWGEEQENAFNVLKDHIIRCTVSLGYFSEQDHTVLYTDASPNALGAVLVQESTGKSPRLISFASKALTSTEKNYAQNQREALAAVWAVEHFSYFLLGRHFTLRTDARGITFIFDRTRENNKRALTRADGWALRLSPYSYSIEYVKGTDNIADPSSRLYQGSDTPFDEESSPWEIACLEANAVSFLTEDEVRESTLNDETLQQVTSALTSGIWPTNLKRFQAVSNDLAVNDGVLTKRGCAVIPVELRKKTLEVAHAGHPLSAKFKSILRERVWWPGISADADEWVNSCKYCAMNGKPEKTTPMQRMFAPRTVWETVAIDFNGPYAKFGGISILVIIDYRSRYAFARPVKSTGFEHTKKVLDEVFDKEGLPKTIKSDNGPPFNGEEYQNYCSQRGIKTVFSTPFFPQQNGLVENFMKVVNKAMCTASSSGNAYNEELQAAVHAHNSAAHPVTKMPPEEVMYGRKIHRRLPLINRGKANIDEKLLTARDTAAKLYSKAHEDARRGAKHSKVSPGDTVILERHIRGKGDARFDTKRHTVVDDSNGSLVLADENGSLVRRHVSQTKRVHQWRDEEMRKPDNRDSELVSSKRPSRDHRAPKHLSDYVQIAEKI